jgi:hypothetical protein
MESEPERAVRQQVEGESGAVHDAVVTETARPTAQGGDHDAAADNASNAARWSFSLAGRNQIRAYESLGRCPGLDR